MSASITAALVDAEVHAIVSRLALRPGPGRAFHHPESGARVGEAMLWEGAVRLVRINLYLPPIGLDSHLIFAFTPPDSAAPHFTLDAVQTGEALALHLDLVPRLDLGANLAHLQAVYEPMTTIFQQALAIGGLRVAALSPTQRALMSPWMLAVHAERAAFEALRPVVEAYRAHWLGLLDVALPGDTADRAERDRRLRGALFSPEVDPVWARVERLVGAVDTAFMRQLLSG